MISQKIFNKLAAPIINGLKNVLAKAVIGAVKDSTNLQIVQIGILEGETKGGVERVQNYGFTSHPLVGAEAFVGFINGNKDHAVVIAVDDSRHRLKNLKPGEVAIYNNKGLKIILKDDGSGVLDGMTKLYLGGNETTLLPTSGVVTGESLDPITGLPFPDKSSVVFARKI